MKSIASFFFPSTDTIVGKLGRMVQKLEAHTDRQVRKAVRKSVRADMIRARAIAHEMEADKARKVRAKIADLIG